MITSDHRSSSTVQPEVDHASALEIVKQWNPAVENRAWLVFSGTDAVDGKRGLASWGMSSTGPTPPPIPPS
jgi:hypothetical protein